METITMKRSSLGVAVAVVCLLGSAATPSAAQSNPKAEAQRLFEEAKTLADGGRWAEACLRLEESLRLERNMTTDFRLADCYDHVGRNASAWEHYRAAAEAAAAAGETDKEQFANERAKRLEVTVDKLVIVPPDIPDVRVERDGRLVPAVLWRKPIPIDRGEHTVHVWAPGKASYDTLVTVAGRGATVRIDVPPLEDPIPWRLAPGAQVTTSMVERPIGGHEGGGSPKRSFKSLSPWGYGIGIVGLAAMGSGIALYIATAESNESACGDGRCVPSVGLISVGAVAMLIGGVLVLISNAD
jgi:hypothetical protein